MDSNPNSYVIMIETEDNVFKILTKKLNVREAREKLEVVNIALSKVALSASNEAENMKHPPKPMRAFIYNTDALASAKASANTESVPLRNKGRKK